MSDTASKLRAEIQGAKGYRHDFVLRKFAFGTVLLGAGSFTAVIPKEAEFVFAQLLYLVPVIAIAFDLYILTEDYRIKRAGEFIKSKNSGSDEPEQQWEAFAHKAPNHGSTVAFSLVTLLFLIGATIVLWPVEENKIKLYTWFAIVVVIECALVGIGFYLRTHLENKANEIG